jgi:hypothetical protein
MVPENAEARDIVCNHDNCCSFPASFLVFPQLSFFLVLLLSVSPNARHNVVRHHRSRVKQAVPVHVESRERPQQYAECRSMTQYVVQHVASIRCAGARDVLTFVCRLLSQQTCFVRFFLSHSHLADNAMHTFPQHLSSKCYA